MQSRLAGIVDRLGAPRLLVVGDLILDRYVWGQVQRISPEAPVQILNAAREEFRAGGAANVANNLSVLKARASCAGIVGRDPEGDELAGLMKAAGIDSTHFVRDASRPTSMKTRLIAHNQQMLRIDREQIRPPSPAIERALVSAVRTAASSHDGALISDYNKGTLTPRVCGSLIAAFRRRHRPVLVGLKGRDFRKYRGATGASLNRTELAHLTGDEQVSSGARKLLRALELQFLVVTLGERGMTVFHRSGSTVGFPAVARQVFDVTGAGDTVLSAFAVGHASGLSLEECALLANGAAGVVVGKVGTATVTREELRDYAAADGTTSGKLLDPGALKAALAHERSRGKRIVVTNGCFDLLHAGHLKLLNFARSKGDVLVVALNTDRSVRRLKGPSRPVLPEADRAALIAAFECVDYVVLFDEETPARLIRRIRPDVLVKGMDYSGKKVVGRKTVETGGGRVELAPLMRGVSTSDLIRRIRGPLQ